MKAFSEFSILAQLYAAISCVYLAGLALAIVTTIVS
jgi:hypothetical protein